MRKLGELLNWANKEEPLPAIELRPTNDLPRARAMRFTLASGARPLDGYTIRRGVGIGGFGEVYYATSDAGKDVALKKIQRNLDIEVRGVTQCLNLKHINLVALFDIRQDSDDQAWVVMEFVSGDNLQQTLEKHPNGLPIDEVLKWWDGITAGVAYLHDCGIVHRDLKPGNIFCDNGVVKIGDYGLSKFISCSRRSGQTQSVGTFHYMAPEIGQGRYGKEIDVYALGIMLYEMITGKVPYDGESSQEIIMKHLTAEPPLEGIASPYREVIQRALAKDPTQRFASVTDMRSILPGQPTAAPAGATPSPFASVATASFKAGTPHGTGTVSPGTGSPKPGINAIPIPDEPVARAVTSVVNDIQMAWRGVSPNARRAILGVSIAVLLMNARLFGRYAGVLIVAYIAYLSVRALLSARPRPIRLSRIPSFPLKHGWPPRPRVANFTAPVATTPTAQPHSLPKERTSKRKIEQQLRLVLAKKSSGERITELCSSLLASALVVPVLSFVAMLFLLYADLSRPLEMFPNFLWITLSGTMFTWVILVAGKLWESHDADDSLRRFLMLLLGLLGGAASFGLIKLLGANPPMLVAGDAVRLGSFHAADGQALLPAYLAYFCALLSVLRWWRHADPARRVRLNVMATAGTILVAYLLQNICPVPAGFVLAGIIAVSVQLAASWIPRTALGTPRDPAYLDA